MSGKARYLKYWQEYCFGIFSFLFPGRSYEKLRPLIRESIREYGISEENEMRKKYFNYVIRTLIHIMDDRDKMGYAHSENVVKHAAKIAKALRLSREDILKIKIAALVHDLGKYEIDKAILQKAGKLTKREWAKVKKHPQTSAVIMREIGILREIAELVRHHHERYGGGGYPSPGRKGVEIPLGARIIAVADAYDAMISKRPYRKRRMTRKEAITELKRCAGKQFDPGVVAAFIG
jgi:putative nucleotidyltransferase with HDIG domain